MRERSDRAHKPECAFAPFDYREAPTGERRRERPSETKNLDAAHRLLSGAALPLACSSISGDDSSNDADASYDASGFIDTGIRYGAMGVADAGPGYDAASDASDGDSFYPASSLPDGGCSSEGSRCTLTVSPCCGVLGGVELVDGYTCSCTGGEWQCAITSPGAGSCFYGEVPNCTDGGGN
jgi:hypothetical protein